MKIENLSPLITYKGDTMLNVDKPQGVNFADVLQKAIQDVNNTQETADEVSEAFALGKIDNVHDVTVATEQARLALELTIAVRSKVVEAYKEIMRMQF